jgi:Putative transcriptional regulator
MQFPGHRGAGRAVADHLAGYIACHRRRVGPKQSLITLGYAGWEAGQLEAELADNAWLNCPFDPEIIFGLTSDLRLEAAAASLGINLNLLTSQAGHA